MVIEETEEQAAARVRSIRARRALAEAPDVALHVRALATSGEVERGETLPQWNSPLRVTAQDDLDEFYAQLIDWVTYWSATLRSMSPSAAVVAWANRSNGEVQGFQASTTPAGVHILTKLNAGWLLVRFDQIAAHEAGRAFEDDINSMVFKLQAKYGLTKARIRPVASRPCPVCGEYAVRADITPDGPSVKCDKCWHEVPVESYRSILSWMDISPRQGWPCE